MTHTFRTTSATRRARSLLCITIAIVALARSIAADDQHGNGQTSFDTFDLVGTWLWTTDFGALGTLPSLVTYHEDGTIVVSDSSMFGNPLAPPSAQGAKLSAMHGVWRRIGRRTFGGTSLWFRFNAAGFVVGYGRARSTLELVDRDHFEGVMYLDSLSGCNINSTMPPIGCPDPTDPAAIWIPNPLMPPGWFPVSATRVKRIAVPE
jgi:hypothetical protein